MPSGSYSIFLVKNFLILVLQIYRLVSLYKEHEAEKKKKRAERTTQLLKTMYRNAFFLGKMAHAKSIGPGKVNIGVDYGDLNA